MRSVKVWITRTPRVGKLCIDRGVAGSNLGGQKVGLTLATVGAKVDLGCRCADTDLETPGAVLGIPFATGPTGRACIDAIRHVTSTGIRVVG